MFGPTSLRDIFLVAGFELREGLRSRRIFLAGVLYMIIAGFASYIFVDILTRVQPITNPAPLARNRGPMPGLFGGGGGGPRPQTPNGTGATANLPAATTSSSNTKATTPTQPVAAAPASTNPDEKALFRRGSPFREVLRQTTTDQPMLDFLLSQPPITLFHVLVSLALLPFMVMLTSSESIAQEHQNRGIRFIALRTGRAEFVLGKLLGQGVIIALLTLLSGGMCMAVAAWKLDDFEFLPATWALLLFWPRIVAYCVGFLGLAGLCSMNSSSTVVSRTFSLVGLIGLWMAHHLSQVYIASYPADSAKAHFFRALDFLMPYSHQNDLWRPEFAQYGAGMASLLFLGALYTTIGLFFYRRRDL